MAGSPCREIYAGAPGEGDDPESCEVYGAPKGEVVEECLACAYDHQGLEALEGEAFGAETNAREGTDVGMGRWEYT